jgi:hypothetical protein
MDRLAKLRREIQRERKRTSPGKARARLRRRPGHLPALAFIAALVVLPFLVLLRGATYFCTRLGWPTWIAMGAAGLLTLALLTAYAAFLSRAFTGKSRTRFVAQWIAAPLVIAYCLHALLFLSSVNAKTSDVRAYYRSLHPMLRLAVSTFVIVDPRLVVTDIYRIPADYAAMGLPVYEASLHFRQADGYVHAMDLRTIGRGAVRSWVTAAYFRVLGFRTLRHEGTEDHLHVSLPLGRRQRDAKSPAGRHSRPPGLRTMDPARLARLCVCL